MEVNSRWFLNVHFFKFFLFYVVVFKYKQKLLLATQVFQPEYREEVERECMCMCVYLIASIIAWFKLKLHG